ncbi:unnamed protein product [Pylaiella littoralis]
MAILVVRVLLSSLLLHTGTLAEEKPVAFDPAALFVPLSEQEENSSVLVLNSTSLEATLQKGAPLMVEFYAPSCGHCNEPEPEYAKAAKDLQKDGLLLGKVDCDAYQSLCDEDKWDIGELPAIKVARGGESGPIHDYSGPRSAADIAAFMRQVAAYSSPELDHADDGAEELDDVLAEEEGVLVLGEHNFAMAADRFVLLLVVFHVPGCDSCSSLRQEYLEASDVLYEYFIPVAKVDCFAQADFCRQPRWRHAALKATAGITTTGDKDEPDESDAAVVGDKAPTMFVVREGEVFGYGGDPPFKAFDMVEFAKELAGISDEEEEEGEQQGGRDVGVDESNLLVLDESNFQQALDDTDVILLEFFAPWCGNCKRLQPRYGRAADALVKEGNVARLAKIDCTENAALCSQEPWSIKRYPTMMLKRFGKLYEFDGPPEAKDIVRYMRKATEPALHVLKGQATVAEFIHNNEVAVVGIMERDGSSAHLKLKEAAESEFGRAYGVTFDDGVASFFGVASGSKIVVMKHFDQEKLSMHVFSFTKKEDIEAFVRGASKKMYLEIGTDEAADVLSARPLAIFVLTEEERVPSMVTRDMMELVQMMAKNALEARAERAADKANVVRYVHAPMNAAGSRLMEFLVGQKNRGGAVPGAFLVAPGAEGKAIKYRHDGELTVEGLQEFERLYFAGELKPHFKSEPLSEADEDDPLKTVKAASFERMVIDNPDNDVLVDFYAPWCPHCQRLGPIYGALAAKMEEREKLVIADMDVSANDLDYPGLSTTKLPTVLMFKAGSKDKPEIYDGELELEPLEAFINEQATHKQPVVPAATASTPADSPPQDEL